MRFSGSYSKKKFIIITIFFCALFTLRVYNLDCDLPVWGLVNYQPMDEGQYATMAISKIEYTTIRPDLKDVNIEFYTSEHMRNNFLEIL